MRNKILKYSALITLITAYIIGQVIEKTSEFEKIKSYFPDLQIEKLNENPALYSISSPIVDSLLNYVVIESTQGWGGPLTIASVIGIDGKVDNVIVLDHKETPSFYEALLNYNFFKQFSGKDVSDEFDTDIDINALSGATISSKAITNSIRDGSHWVGREKFDLSIITKLPELKIGSNEFILILLYAIVIISVIKKYTKIRLVLLAFSIVFMGFYINSPISISNISSLFLGYFPSIYDQMLWWLIVVGTLAMVLLYGKNVYCYWICPFGGMQEFISLIGGIKIKISKRVSSMLSYIVYFLFWFALMITFLTNNPSLGTFEPFAALFSFKGIGIQWYIVSLAIIGSFLIPRFWCKFFCPVGVFLNWVSKIKLRLPRKYRFNSE